MLNPGIKKSICEALAFSDLKLYVDTCGRSSEAYENIVFLKKILCLFSNRFGFHTVACFPSFKPALTIRSGKE
jgi:hypothetical protein